MPPPTAMKRRVARRSASAPLAPHRASSKRSNSGTSTRLWLGQCSRARARVAGSSLLEPSNPNSLSEGIWLQAPVSKGT
ncbi:hypothetical protein D3C76_1204280 [compost metagenome]